jgi:hypothetical protein
MTQYIFLFCFKWQKFIFVEFEESLRSKFFCVFFLPNDNGPATSIVLGVHVFRSKTRDKKGLMACKIENEIFVMKKHCEVEYFDI